MSDKNYFLSRTNKGFSLIELLLAMAIFAYAASAILSVVSQSARNLSDFEQITFASWVANNQLVYTQNDDTWPPKDNAKGEVDMAGLTWYWQQKVTETEFPTLRQVQVMVYDDPSRKTELYRLTTFISKKGN